MSSSGGAATPFSSNATTAANYSGASSKSVHSKMVAKDALGSSTDVVWKHGIHFRDPRIVQCKFCLKIITGGGIYTLRSHLAGTGKDGDACKCVSDEVKKEMVDAVFGLQQNIIKKSSFDEEKIAKFGENAFGSRTKTWKRGTYFKRDRRNHQRKFCQKIRTGYVVDRLHFSDACKGDSGSIYGVAWKYGICFRDPRIVQCKFCLKVITGGGIYALRSHLAGTGKDGDACKSVSDKVKKEMVDAVFGLQQNIIKKSSFGEEKIAKFGENAFGGRTKTWKCGTYFKRDRRNRQRKFCQKIRTGYSVDRLHFSDACKGDSGSIYGVAWKYGIRFRDPRIVQCKFCLKIITGGGIYALRSHLAGTGKDGDACKSVSDEVKKEMVDAVFGLQQNIIKKSSFGEEKIAKFGENAFGSRTKTWKRGTCFKRDRRNRQHEFCQKIRTGYAVDRLHFSDACKGDSGSIYGVAWKYGIRFRDPRIVQCKFCQKIITGGVFYLKYHLAGNDGDACKSVSDEVKKEMLDAILALQV